MKADAEISSPARTSALPSETAGPDYEEPIEPVRYDFGLSRRGFVQILGAGLSIASGASPRTVPVVRQGAAAARQLLIDFACKQWAVEPNTCEVRDGKAIHTPSKRSFTYADLATNEDAAKLLEQAIPSDVSLTPVKEW